MSSNGDILTHTANSLYVMTAYQVSTGSGLKVTYADLSDDVFTSSYTLSLSGASFKGVGFALSESFSLFVTQNSSQTLTDFWISTAVPNTVAGGQRNYTTGFAIRDYDLENNYAKIYYSKKSTSISSNANLTVEVVDLDFTTIDSDSYTVSN